jgi:predicted porin
MPRSIMKLAVGIAAASTECRLAASAQSAVTVRNRQHKSAKFEEI